MYKTMYGAVSACAFIAMAGQAVAADVPMMVAPEVVDPPASMSFYAKAYGGATAPNTLLWNGADYDVDQGWIGGAAAGVTLDSGLSFELDVTGSSALYTGEDNFINGWTLMANAIYEAPIADTFGVYGGIGLGGVFVEYNADDTIPAYTATGSAWGGQIFAGVSFDLTENVSLFGEARYQTAFGDVSVTDSGPLGTYDVGFARTAVLAGIRVSN